MARSLVNSNAGGPDVAEVVFDALRPDHPDLMQILIYAGYLMHLVPGGADRMLAFHDHPHPDVRFWLGSALCSFQRVHGGLDYETAAPVLRKLVLEGNYHAVGALECFEKLQAADREVLEAVIRRDPNDNVAHHARDCLEKHPELR